MTKEINIARNAGILRMWGEGASLARIVGALGVNKNVVAGVINRYGQPRRESAPAETMMQRLDRLEAACMARINEAKAWQASHPHTGSDRAFVLDPERATGRGAKGGG